MADVFTEQVVYLPSVDTEFGHIGVKKVTKIIKNGVEVSRSIHRGVLAPGDSLVGKDALTTSIANVVWTPTVLSDWQAWKIANPSK